MSNENWPKSKANQFDHALPSELVGISTPSPEAGFSVPIKIEYTTPSPYVIRITAPGDEPKALVSDPIDALASSLIIDGDPELLTSEAPLYSFEESDLAVHPEELVEQIVETKPYSNDVISLSLPKYTASYDHSLPSIFFISDRSVDLNLDRLDEDNLNQSSSQSPVTVQTPYHWHRSLVAFASTVGLVSLPFTGLSAFASVNTNFDSSKAKAMAGIEAIARGGELARQGNLAAAQAAFNSGTDTLSGFNNKINLLRSLSGTLSTVSGGAKKAQTATALFSAMESLGQVGNLLSKAAVDIEARQSLSLAEKLAVMSQYATTALPLAQKAKDNFAEIDLASVPAAYQEQVTQAQTISTGLWRGLDSLYKFSGTINTLLGTNGSAHYLVVFQNTNELRATGGFMGSFAQITIDNGKLVDVSIPGGGTYDLQGQLTAFVSSPGPLQLINPRWEFQDANWFPDFPTSARKILWFYEKSGGPTVDGVIAVNSDVLTAVLDIVGAVKLGQDGKVIDSENAIFELQNSAQVELAGTSSPKALVGDLFAALFERANGLDLDTSLTLTQTFIDSFSSRDLQIYLNDNDSQRIVESLGWSGKLQNPVGDYLLPVSTNIGGGKSDAAINKKLDLTVNIGPDGTVTNIVTLTKEHRGLASDLFAGLNNVDYFRLYVPRGSRLMSVTGTNPPADDLFEESSIPLSIDADFLANTQNVEKDSLSGTDIWEESGKTVFGNWIQTAPGKTSQTTFVYELPFKVSPNSSSSVLDLLGANPSLYELSLEHPSGSDFEISVSLKTPDNWEPVWQSDSIPPNFNKNLHFGWMFLTKK